MIAPSPIHDSAQAPASALAASEDGRLARNILAFARLLRAAGLAVGPDRAAASVQAAAAVGLEPRADFYWALRATLCGKREDLPLFDEAFAVYWRDPQVLERLTSLLLPAARFADPDAAKRQLSPRLAQALAGDAGQSPPPPEEKVEFDAALSFSDQEQLAQRDFEKMSLDELAAAKAAIRRLKFAFPPIRSRRLKPDPRGRRFDGRATLRASLRAGGAPVAPRFCAPKRVRPPVAALVDISGSMARYARMTLHFLHALAAAQPRCSAFLFGTRLTDVSRAMKRRDVDQAVDAAAKAAADWSGGTRIGETLRQFNRRWSRRALGHGAVMLLITDGLDRDAGAGVALEAERLAKSCRRLIWLNPLLRYAGFQAVSTGARALLPHVHEHRPAHNLQSLEALTAALAAPAPRVFSSQSPRR